MDRLTELQALAAEDPQDPFTRYLLGQALLEQARASDALPHLEAACRLDADNPVVYRLLGQAQQALGRDAEALQTWDAGIAVAERTGLIQTGKEMKVFADRLRRRC